MSPNLYPKTLLDSVRKIVEDHPESIDAALEKAVKAVHRMPERETFIATLERQAIREIVCGFRHQINVTFRNGNGDYATKPRAEIDASVSKVYESIYNYVIAGMAIGWLVGKDLTRLAEMERNRADGHVFNAKFLESIIASGAVGEDQRVMDAIPEKRLRKIFDQLNGKRKKDAA